MNRLRQLEPTQSKSNTREQINGKDLNSGLLTWVKLVANSKPLWHQSSHPGKPQAQVFAAAQVVTHFGSLPCTVLCFLFFHLKKKYDSCTAQRTFFRTTVHTPWTALSSKQDYSAVTGTAVILQSELCKKPQTPPSRAKRSYREMTDSKDCPVRDILIKCSLFYAAMIIIRPGCNNGYLLLVWTVEDRG